MLCKSSWPFTSALPSSITLIYYPGESEPKSVLRHRKVNLKALCYESWLTFVLSPATLCQLDITLEAVRGWGPAGQELPVTRRDSRSWSKHPDNLVSNSVSHSRPASGCQSSSGIHLAAVMPKTLKWWNNLPSVFLLLNCGSFLRIKEHGKCQQQWLRNTLITDHCLSSFKDFFLCASFILYWKHYRH